MKALSSRLVRELSLSTSEEAGGAPPALVGETTVPAPTGVAAPPLGLLGDGDEPARALPALLVPLLACRSGDRCRLSVSFFRRTSMAHTTSSPKVDSSGAATISSQFSRKRESCRILAEYSSEARLDRSDSIRTGLQRGRTA